MGGPREPVDEDPRRPQLFDLLMMVLASRTVDFRIRGADPSLHFCLAGHAVPDGSWGGECEDPDEQEWGSPTDPTVALDREVFHGILGGLP